MKKLFAVIVVALTLATLAGWTPVEASVMAGSPDAGVVPVWFEAELLSPPSFDSSHPPHKLEALDSTSLLSGSASREIVLREEDDGRLLAVNENQTVVIRLPVNPSTGYSWRIAGERPSSVQQVGATEFESSSDLIGAPGEQIMRLRLREAGDASLLLTYQRVWEEHREPLRNFSVRLRGVGSFIDGPKSVAVHESSTAELSEPERVVAEKVRRDSSLSSSFNWCSQGGCTSVKNQGSCGSCWAFATNGVVESAIKIRDGVGRDLSEQYLVSCNTDGYGCGGGWWAFDYYVDEGEADDGVVYEADFPYRAADVSCNSPYPYHETISYWGGAGSSVSTIKQTIQSYGPVAAAICVGSAFNNYRGGVFSTDEAENCGGGVNHAVVLVGWDDTQGSSGVWHLKNSWGSGWGESGYMRIEYGVSNVGYGAVYASYEGGENTANNPPYAPSSPTPADGAHEQSIGVNLSWTGGDPDGDAVTYDVYLEAGDPTPDIPVCSDLSTTACDPGSLEHDTRYYWKVVAQDSEGETAIGDVWEFATEGVPNDPPYVPSNPSPADGAEEQNIDVDLSWTGGDPDGDGVTYDVYFEPRDATPDEQICRRVASALCDPGMLEKNTSYYWQVVAEDSHGEKTAGPVWSFATEEGVQADFSAEPRKGVAPLTVTFTDLSSGDYDDCSWDFGDGAMASQCGIVDHVYHSPGGYAVGLTVSSPEESDVRLKQDLVTVYEMVEAAFTGEPREGVAPTTVEFANESTGDYDACVWDFGDGGKSNECGSVDHAYESPGIFAVTLTVRGPGGEDTATQVEYVKLFEKVEARLAVEPAQGISPLEVTFTNVSTGDYDTCTWDLGDGTVVDDCGDGDHVYEWPGEYTVSLTVTGRGGTDSQTRAGYVRAYERVEASFDAEPLEGAAPLEVFFNNLSSGDYGACTWDFGEGSVSSGCGDVSNVYRAPGSYTVTLDVAGPGGSARRERPRYVHVNYPPDPVSDVVIRQIPAGDTFVGDEVRFLVEAQGTVPFSYTWSVNGVDVGEDANLIRRTLTGEGLFTVGVTVTNVAGEAAASKVVEVRVPTSLERPDLSRSFQVASPRVVQGGDTLTYTTFLQNDSSVVAQADLVDPIPAYTEYVEGSAAASDGGQVVIRDGSLHWSGRIGSGAPVVLAYQVRVQETEALQAGAPIGNAALVRDGSGRQLLLEADVVYDSVVGLEINGGALYTNIPTVTLEIRNPEGLPHMQLCSQGRFGGEPAWRETDTATRWRLDPAADLQGRAVVYGVFRGEHGKQHGPIYDDVVYDPIPPQIAALEIVSRTAKDVDLGAEPVTVVRVTVEDAISGVTAVHLSDDPAFETFVVAAIHDEVVEVTVPWVMGPTSGIFVRAVDRAGNYSDIISKRTYAVYLPLAIRSPR